MLLSITCGIIHNMWYALMFIILIDGSTHLALEPKSYDSFEECIERAAGSEEAFYETGAVQFLQIKCTKLPGWDI